MCIITWLHMKRLCWTSRQHWWEQVDNMLVDLPLSVTNGSSWARAWMARFTDGDAHHYTISILSRWTQCPCSESDVETLSSATINTLFILCLNCTLQSKAIYKIYAGKQVYSNYDDQMGTWQSLIWTWLRSVLPWHQHHNVGQIGSVFFWTLQSLTLHACQ